MTVIQTVTEENFIRRIAAHIREEYAKSVVKLPDSELAVEELPEDTLHLMVRGAVEKARSYGLTFESSIAAFAAVMFEVAPNFDEHRLCQVLLDDEEIEPDLRLDEMLGVLTQKNWDSIRESYDANAWRLSSEE